MFPDRFPLSMVQSFLGSRSVGSGHAASSDTTPRAASVVQSPDTWTESIRERAAALAERGLRTGDVRLAARALELDPHCVDALLHLARESAGSHGELIELVRLAVGAAERALGGPAFIAAHRGRFCCLPQTQPYVRARIYLAQLLMEGGQTNAAIAEYEAILELDACDSIWLRDTLLACYLEYEQSEAPWTLLDRFPGDRSTLFGWVRVLRMWMADGHEGAVREALQAARRANRYVEAYLTGSQKLPASLPDAGLPGDQNEAILCASALRRLWARSGASRLLRT